MFTVRKLGKKDKNGNSHVVLLEFCRNRIRIKRSTGIKVKVPKDWDIGKGQPMKSNTDLKGELLKIETRVKNCIESNPSKIELEKKINEILGKSIETDSEDIIKKVDEFIQFKKKNGLVKHVDYKREVLTFLNTMKIVGLKQVDNKVVMSYRAYLLRIKRTKKQVPLSNKTINLKIRQILVFLNYYKISIDKKEVFLKESKNLPVFVSEEELDMLLDLYGRLSNTNRKRVLRYYLIGVYTGLRYSDICRLKDYSNYVDKGDLIEMRTKKTNILIRVPKHRMLVDFLNDDVEQKKGIMDRSIVSREMKKITEICGFESRINFEKTSNTKVINKTVYKRDVLTFHSSRCAFVSRAMNSNIPKHIVRAVTGHTNDVAFNGYLGSENRKISEEFKKMGYVF